MKEKSMLRPKYLLFFFATFCAIAVTVVSLSLPCRAEQEGTELDAPSEAFSKQEEAEDTSKSRKSLPLKGVKEKRKGQAPGSFH